MWCWGEVLTKSHLSDEVGKGAVRRERSSLGGGPEVGASYPVTSPGGSWIKVGGERQIREIRLL